MHNYPGMPVGEFGIRPGPVMAAADYITIDIEGHGAHAARPHLGIDTVLVARAHHHRHAVGRVAQCRSAEVGGRVDPRRSAPARRTTSFRRPCSCAAPCAA